MNKQFNDLLQLYKQFVNIFNNWENTDSEDINYSNYDLLVKTYHSLTDLLVSNNVIEKYGIKNYQVVETGEII